MTRREIPTTFRGVSTEEAYKRIMNSKEPAADPGSSAPMNISANINRREYIQIPQHGISIAVRETHLNKNIYDTLDALSDEGLKAPSIQRFMTHWKNVCEAAKGKRTLLYADGAPVERDSAVDLWNYMSSTDRTLFNGKPCWTWLDALFEEENGIMHMITDLKTITQNKKKSLTGIKKTLDSFLKSDGLVDLNFNNQGLPTQPSSHQNYVQGENIYFWQPVNGRVARFYAGSDGAGLDCGGDPSYGDSNLGVFAVAEGGK